MLSDCPHWWEPDQSVSSKQTVLTCRPLTGVCTWFTFRSYLLHDCPERFLHFCMPYVFIFCERQQCFFQYFDRLGNNLSIGWILCWPIYIFCWWKTTPDWLSTVSVAAVSVPCVLGTTHICCQMWGELQVAILPRTVTQKLQSAWHPSSNQPGHP